MSWTGDATAIEGMWERPFALEGDGGIVPGAVWFAGRARPRPLVLLSHGGSGHALNASTRATAKYLVHTGDFVVGAIDGPVHGRRRQDGDLDPGASLRAYRRHWTAGDGGREAMTRDWRRALDFMLEQPFVDPHRVGYMGLSMGTAYGIPLCARDSRIQAIVLGLWALDYPNSTDLSGYARDILQPLLFLQKRHDERMSQAGQLALFDSFGSTSKQLNLYPGSHAGPCEAINTDACGHLVRHLHQAPPSSP